MQKRAPYGTWKSPISAEQVSSSASRIFEISLGNKGDVFFLEMRPKELGRCVLVQMSSDGSVRDLTPAGYNVRTRVHEYGGGSYLIHDGVAYFANFADQRLYRQEIREGSTPDLFSKEPDRFYADFIVDPNRSRILCVREDHSAKGKEPVNTIVALSLDGTKEEVLVSGNDFYSNPRLNPDGSKLAWLSWNHPSMPFFGTELVTGMVSEDGSIKDETRIAGGKDESISEPQWSPAGILHFVSDRSGWRNLYRLRNGRIEPLQKLAAEFASPQWVFGLSSYSFVSDEKIICTFTQNGIWNLSLLDPKKRSFRRIKSQYTEFHYIRANGRYAFFLAASPTSDTALVRLDVARGSFRVLYGAKGEKVKEGYVSKPKPISYPTSKKRRAHGLYYAPRNKDYSPMKKEKPPLIVISHGGPTAAAQTSLSLSIQYWTSRGFGVLDVNYGGSTGYGREYMMRLNGQWGVIDVDDCASGALYLARRGLADKGRLIIRGGSAGGYTTLCALAFRKTFSAGASYYGVSDLELMARDTHKFESRYLDSLIGPYPEKKELYHERSAIYHVKDISAPVIFFQGLEDKVVPPSQAETMFDALKSNNVPTAYVPFEGEQHGFRQAKNIERSLGAELYFYSKIYGFEPADKIEPVRIENLRGTGSS